MAILILLNKKKNIIVLASFFITLVFLLKNINYDNLWFDEILTFWIADPGLSTKETLERHWSIEQLPPLYNFINKYVYLVFGYDPNFGRYISALFGALSIVLIPFLTNQKKKVFFISFILCLTNVFIYKYSQEMRPYSMFFFFSILNLFFIKKIFQKIHICSFKYFILFSVSNFFLIISHPFGLIQYLSLLSFYFLYFIKYNSINIKIFYLLLINFFISVFLIVLYFYNLNSFPNWIQPIDLKFFSNLYFSKFFGSRLIGFLFLIIFIYCLLINIKKLIKLNFHFFLLILFFLGYALPITYGYLIKPILNERYIIFVIIPVIVIIVESLVLKKKNYILLIFLLLTSVLNSFTEASFKQFYQPREKYKDNYKEALQIINDSNVNYILLDSVSEVGKNAIFNYLTYLNKSNNFNEIFRLKDFYEFNNDFWVLCIGNCIVKSEEFTNFNIKKEIYLKNIKLRLINKI